MIVSVIASGSNGNCTLIEENGAVILIDAGMSGREIERRMRSLGRTLADVDAVVVSHAHHDHTAGAGVISRRYGLPIYMTADIRRKAAKTIRKVIAKEYTRKKPFTINGLEIRPVRTLHDTPSSGFVIGDFGIFTDTGCVTKEMRNVVPMLKAALLESNHDVEMLLHGPYPEDLKARILSDKGHLSNETAGGLVEADGAALRLVLLGHLSGENNTPRLAARTFASIVKRKLEYRVCSREDATGSWEI